MIYLALDTSASVASLALFSSEKLLVTSCWEGSSSHTERLPLELLSLCHLSKISIKDIDAFALSLGPGSFTGLRVGLSFVKGLAAIDAKPVVGISTLRAMVETVDDSLIDWVCPWIDARRDEVYAAFYRRQKESWIEQIDEGAFLPQYFLEMLRKEKLAHAGFFVGSGAKRYAGLIHAASFEILEATEIALAPAIGRLALPFLQRNEGVPGAVSLLPNYLRGSAAEIKRGAS